ncbi:MAG TPA: ATP-binding protein [Gaiellaceae bacterium]|jgi:DNA replication protein DnaC|nr:ATP-binding protein [Gaiellaceae bacterium]
MSDAISPELRSVLRRLRLGPILETLPERLTLARQQQLSIPAFLETVLADEVARRDRLSGDLRAKAAALDPEMRLERWDEGTDVRFDRRLWGDLCTLRFLEDAHNVLVLGPVGVGKTMLASCLGHIACRRRRSVLFFRTERMLKTLRAARLDASYESEMRRLVGVDLLVLDDFALQSYDHQETADLYELVVERHRRSSTVVVSNREPKEWLAMMADPLLAQSAVDRLLNAAYELVLEGDSYRRHQKPRSEGDAARTEALRSPQRPAGNAVGTTASPSERASEAPRRSRARERGARKPQGGRT